jgi:hypothetical protein
MLNTKREIGHIKRLICGKNNTKSYVGRKVE